jgi:hypothetical protein
MAKHMMHGYAFFGDARPAQAVRGTASRGEAVVCSVREIVGAESFVLYHLLPPPSSIVPSYPPSLARLVRSVSGGWAAYPVVWKAATARVPRYVSEALQAMRQYLSGATRLQRGQRVPILTTVILVHQSVL